MTFVGLRPEAFAGGGDVPEGALGCSPPPNIVAAIVAGPYREVLPLLRWSGVTFIGLRAPKGGGGVLPGKEG